MAVANVPEGLAESVGTGGAGRDDAKIDGLRLEFDGHDARGDVGNQRRDGERRNARRATLDQDTGLVFDGFHPADTGTDDHAKAVRINFGDVDGGVLNGQTGSGDGVLRVAVVSLGFLRVHILSRVEIPDLCSDFGREVRRVEASDTRNP